MTHVLTTQSQISLPDPQAADGRPLQKRTKQVKEAIAEIVRDIPRGVHLTASEVFRRARDLGLNVSLSTVYRTLANMQADGNVSTVSGEHGRRYEARDLDHDHDHLICVKCGFTVEFTDDLIRGFGKAVAERKGYEHTTSRFDILGICAQCKAKDEDHKIASLVNSAETAKDLIWQTLDHLGNATKLLEARKLAKARETLMAIVPQLQQALAEVELAADTNTTVKTE